MGAIAGILLQDGQPVTQPMVDRLAAAAPSRGLDGNHTWLQHNFGALRQSNATTHEELGERQPHIGQSGALVLFDGRLDNRTDLLAEVGSLPANAADGAIVLALYEKLGREFVLRLVGDFAIAVCHPQQRRLALFTSPLNWRPLHWTRQGNRVAFATDARTLAVGLGLDRKLNEGAFAEFLTGIMMTPTETFLHGVERVEQGSAVLFDGDTTQVWLWHDGPFEDWTNRSLDDHVEEFLHLFDQALISTCRSAGPVTAQLSGGLDSSSIVCRATELFRAGRLDRQVLPISARFPGLPHDETRWSTAVGEHLDIPVEVASSTPFSLEAARRWTADTWHLPLRPNALDTLGGVVNQMRQSGRRVLLGGEGGDDWLNGSLAHLPDLLLRGRLGALGQFGGIYFPHDPLPLQWLKTLVLAGRPLVLPSHRRATLHPTQNWDLADADWLRTEWRAKVSLADRLHGPPSRPSLSGFSQRSRYTVYAHGGRQMIAQPVMAFAESHGIEVRHPFHDARLTRFCMGAAGNHMRDRNVRKTILREAMRGTLPEVVRTRTDKAAFYTHTIAAMDQVLRQRPFAEMVPAQLGWIDADRLEMLFRPVRQWLGNMDGSPLPDAPYGPLWFVIAADMWIVQAGGTTG